MTIGRLRIQIYKLAPDLCYIEVGLDEKPVYAIT